MKCPFELPIHINLIPCFSEEEVAYIVQAINSHEKFKTVVQNLVSSATNYPDDYATKELNQLIPFLIKEAKQVLEAEKKE